MAGDLEIDGGEGCSHAETDSCAVNHHQQIGAQSEQPPKEVAEEVTVVENPAVVDEAAVAEEIVLAKESAPPSTDIAIAIPLPEKHNSVDNEEATDANEKIIETTNNEQITDAGDKIIETINDEKISGAGDEIIETINNEKITKASSVAEHGEVTSTTTALGKRKPSFVLNADAEPWTPEDLERSRALLSQSWKLDFPSKKLLVLDVNGLLVARYSKLDKIIPHGTPHRMVAKSFMFKRPFCDSFLEFCFENFYVGVWSSMMEGNVRRSLDYICKQIQHKFLFVMHQGDCTNTGLRNPGKKASPLFLKELAKVWCRFPQGLFNETNTLLIDDTPYKALWNPPYTAIFPEAYQYNEADDFLKTTLPEYLTQLRDAADVREYVRTHPIGEPAIAPGCVHWDDFYEEVVKRKLEEDALSALPTIPATPPPPQTQIFSPELLPQTQISSPESVFSQEVGESFSCAETA